MTSLRIASLRRYVAVAAAGNLVREILQLPLFHIWHHAGLARLGRIILAGTCGDIAIAIAAFVLAICLFGDQRDDAPLPSAVVRATLAFGLAYTIVSEAVHLRLGTWHYSLLMPRLPPLGVGLAPTLQWILIPITALRAADARIRQETRVRGRPGDTIGK